MRQLQQIGQPEQEHRLNMLNSPVSLLKTLALCAALGGAMLVPVSAQSLPSPLKAASSPVWSVSGGTLWLAFNRDLMQELGITLQAKSLENRSELTGTYFSLTEAQSLYFEAPQGALERTHSGGLTATGQLQLTTSRSSKRLDRFSIQPKAGSPRDFQLLDDAGSVWFDIDHAHFEVLQSGDRLSIRNVNLRLSVNAAQWLGNPALAGLAVGTLDLTTPIKQRAEVILPASCANPNWPGNLIDEQDPDQGRYEADVLLQGLASLDYKRCVGICDGPGGTEDGRAIFSPNARLVNSDTDQTADIPWYEKFTGQYPPYDNDQHPYLIWNVYRISNAGKIEHIGRSGVKHAFLTLNSDCEQFNCGDSHILRRKCSDVYSSGNNDSANQLGPRDEIVPFEAVWARCGSVYDRNCDEEIDGTVFTNAEHRMLIPESLLSDTQNYRYFYEAWYIVRDDVNVYNTMGYRQFTPTYTSGIWLSTNEQPFKAGPVIDLWVNPQTPGAGNMSTEVVLPQGRIKVAVRTQALGNGNTRYDYAVMNFDFAQAELDYTVSSAPRMISTVGFDAFSVPTQNATIFNASMKSGTPDIFDWRTQISSAVRFVNESASSQLRWGTMYSFSLEAESAPVPGQVQLRLPAGAGTFSVDSLVPGPGSELLRDDFE